MSERYPMCKDQSAQIDCRNTACRWHVNAACTNVSPAITLSPVGEVGSSMVATCWSFEQKTSTLQKQPMKPLIQYQKCSHCNGGGCPECKGLGMIYTSTTPVRVVDTSVAPPKPETVLVKVPEVVYQSWWDVALTMVQKQALMEEKQQRIRELLFNWVEKNYPGYGVVSFQDFDKYEAKEAAEKTGRGITWGMYVLLQKGAENMQPVNLIDKLLAEGKNIKDVNL